MLVKRSNSVPVVDEPIVVSQNRGTLIGDSINEEVTFDVSDEKCNETINVLSHRVMKKLIAASSS